MNLLNIARRGQRYALVALSASALSALASAVVIALSNAALLRALGILACVLSLTSAVTFFYLYYSGRATRILRDKKRLDEEIEKSTAEYRSAITSLEEKNEYLLEQWSRIERTQREQTRDLTIAKRIQQNILPQKFPAIDGVHFASYYQPIETVGGDFYDTLALSDTEAFFIIADVCGHGVSAALITAMLKALWQSHAPRYTEPADLMKRINDQIVGNLESIQYITAIIGKIDTEKKTLVYANASHPPPLLARGKNVFELTGNKNTLLGKFDRAKYAEDTVALMSMDKLLFYTDGVTEASRDKNKRAQYGIERLKESFRLHANEDIFDGIENMKNDFRRFFAFRKPDDDFTFFGCAFITP